MILGMFALIVGAIVLGVLVWASVTEDPHDRGCDCGKCRERLLRKRR